MAVDIFNAYCVECCTKILINTEQSSLHKIYVCPNCGYYHTFDDLMIDPCDLQFYDMITRTKTND